MLRLILLLIAISTTVHAYRTGQKFYNEYKVIDGVVMDYRVGRHIPYQIPDPAGLDVVSIDIPSRIREIAKDEGFKDADYLVNLAFCESSYDQYAIGDNGESLGLYQIHIPSHPGITKEQAFDIDWSTRWVIKELKNNKASQWSCDAMVK